MDIKEKRRKYYIDNRDRINERNKQYYYDNIEERKKYNNEYWSAHGHKYVKKRSIDNEYKSKQSEYYRKYSERHKHIYQDNFFHATSLNDFIVTFN